jgi:hypothetical protein
LSEDSNIKDKLALNTEEEPKPSLDANGLEEWPELELSEPSEKDPKDAKPGDSERSEETFAGTGEEESSKDSTEMEENALSTDKASETTKNAPEPLLEDSNGEDSTSEVPRPWRDSPDKDNNALPTLEDLTEPLDADGLVLSEVLELWEDSTREPTDAPSGKEVNNLDKSAGTTDSLLSRDSEEADPTALSTEDSTEPTSDVAEKPLVEEEESSEEEEDASLEEEEDVSSEEEEEKSSEEEEDVSLEEEEDVSESEVDVSPDSEWSDLEEPEPPEWTS